MGELDTKPFIEAMKRKYNEEDAEDRASELCSLWDEYMKDPDWHPFKKIREGEKDKVCLSLILDLHKHLMNSHLILLWVCDVFSYF